MIVLDTNVICALMQRAADPAVVAWLDGQPAESVWTTSITDFEIRDVQIAGIAAARNTCHFEGTGIKLVDPWSA